MAQNWSALHTGQHVVVSESASRRYRASIDDFTEDKTVWILLRKRTPCFPSQGRHSHSACLKRWNQISPRRIWQAPGTAKSPEGICPCGGLLPKPTSKENPNHMNSVEFFDPFVAQNSPLPALPRPRSAKLARSTRRPVRQDRSGAREREVQGLIHDLALLKASKKFDSRRI